jgi:hydrogenase maturation protease
MARVLVLGYGNRLRTDDGLGWHVAVELFRTNTSPEVEVLPCHQLTPDLAEAVTFAETVIFIDCAQDGKPGELCHEELYSRSGSTSFTHDLSPSTLLALAAGVCPRAHLVSIWGECYDPGETLSATVSRRVAELETIVRQLIQDSLSKSSVGNSPRTLVS